MTAAERLEEARDYIAKRQGTIDTWHSKERDCPMFGVSFWVWKGKECLGKAMKTGTDLVEIVAFLKEKEQFAIANGVMPKAPEPTPPPAAPDLTTKYCCQCGASNAATSTMCCMCGSYLF